MREITITQFNFEPDIKTFVGQVMAVIDLDADGVREVRGGTHYVEIPVKDPVTDEWVKADADPIRWAELLPEAIGYGDIEVTVQESVGVTVGGAAQESLSPEPDLTATAALVAAVQQP